VFGVNEALWRVEAANRKPSVAVIHGNESLPIDCLGRTLIPSKSLSAPFANVEGSTYLGPREPIACCRE
jgi:hypothetical protein